MQEAGVDSVFIGGLHPETALIFRQARDRGYPVELIASSASATEDFPMIAGPAVEGTLMAGMSDVRENPRAVDVVARFRAQGYEPLGYTLYAYAAVQVWGQAVNAAGTLELEQVTRALHGRQFETVLGTIGFDAEGDVTGVESWQWYVWHADGNYVPLEPSSRDK
jgi:branched-chain amino acid transport system substrate-binding protein